MRAPEGVLERSTAGCAGGGGVGDWALCCTVPMSGFWAWEMSGC